MAGITVTVATWIHMLQINYSQAKMRPSNGQSTWGFLINDTDTMDNLAERRHPFSFHFQKHCIPGPTCNSHNLTSENDVPMAWKVHNSLVAMETTPLSLPLPPHHRQIGQRAKNPEKQKTTSSSSSAAAASISVNFPSQSL